MSLDYTNTTLLAVGTISTPTGGNNYDYIPVPAKSIITAVVVHVRTAGAQTASKLRVRYQGAGDTVVDCAMGTSVAHTVVTARPADADAVIAAGSVLEVAHITTDASAVYDYRVFGTMVFE